MNQRRLFYLLTILTLITFFCCSLSVIAAPSRQTDTNTTEEETLTEESTAEMDTVNISLVNEETPEKEEEPASETAEAPAEAEPTAAAVEADLSDETNDAEAENEVIERPETDVLESETDETEVELIPPEAPVPENPQGEFRSRAMGFYWAPAANAVSYEVKLSNDSSYEETLEQDADDWSCQLNRCIVYTELPGDGSYSWTVTAINDAGSAESEAMDFTIHARIQAPDGYLPNTALSNQKPLTFQWEDVQNNLTAYRIQVADTETDRICLDRWYTVDSMYNGNGVYYLTTDEYLASGTYRWRVQGGNESTITDWSRWVDFEVTCAECYLGTYLNTQSSTVAPIGITIDTAPAFTWQAVTGAANYQLTLSDANGEVLLDEQVSSSNCDIELCNFDPELTLTVGESYVWTVSVYGGNNGFWGSTEGIFTITEPTEMAEIAFIGPEDSAVLDADNQQIVWTDPDERIAAFRLGIQDNAGEFLFVSDLTREDAWCDGITCSIQFRTIPEGENYQIIVVPYSEFNIPGQAIAMTFSNQP